MTLDEMFRTMKTDDLQLLLRVYDLDGDRLAQESNDRDDRGTNTPIQEDRDMEAFAFIGVRCDAIKTILAERGVTVPE